MNAATLRWVLFAAATLAQLAVPLSMIAGREAVLQKGEVFRFRTAPVDPYDAFRGRYVALSLESREAPLGPEQDFRRGQRVFVAITNAPDGFAHLGEVGIVPPPDASYLSLRFFYRNNDRARFHSFLDRYYIEESEAPRAEAAYREQNRGTNRNAYVQVRVRKGQAVIEDLFVGDRPILEVVRQPK